MRTLRPYQTRADEAIEEAIAANHSTLLVLPTGCGKTVVMAHNIRRVSGRCLVLAHREELVHQAAAAIAAINGEPCDIEMAEARADCHGLLGRAKVVVASKDTLRGRRLERFTCDTFRRIYTDEAHHAIADSYRRIYDHFFMAQHVGVTATPDRKDEAALGRVFKSVAMVYEITDAIADGYLVPIRQRLAHLEGLDLSGVGTRAGDLNGDELAAVMTYERPLHGLVSAVLEHAADRRTLIFTSSLAHAERACEIFNRHRPGCARWVSGNTPKDERRATLADYRQGRFQFMCNVGVFTEGFDEPGIGLVVMGRPTKSRSLYAQMIGRGTRPLPGLVDREGYGAEERRAAIAASAKPYLEVMDFAGNCGQHKLISSADILGGNYSEQAIERAASKCRAGGSLDMAQALKDSEAELRDERELLRQEAARKRMAIFGTAKVTFTEVDAFDVFDMAPRREYAWDKNEPASEKQLAFLERCKVPTAGLNKRKANQLIGEIIERRRKKLSSYGQNVVLARYGYPADLPYAKAARLIAEINRHGGAPPAEDFE